MERLEGTVCLFLSLCERQAWEKVGKKGRFGALSDEGVGQVS